MGRNKQDRSDDSDEQVYCVCRQSNPPSGSSFWVSCDDCSNWFHNTCVGVNRKKELGDEWFCRSCTRLNNLYKKLTNEMGRLQTDLLEKLEDNSEEKKEKVDESMDCKLELQIATATIKQLESTLASQKSIYECKLETKNIEARECKEDFERTLQDNEDIYINCKQQLQEATAEIEKLKSALAMQKITYEKKMEITENEARESKENFERALEEKETKIVELTLKVKNTPHRKSLSLAKVCSKCSTKY